MATDVPQRIADGLVLDGGLATELEARGHDLSDDLWSARLLRDAPAEIEAVHRAYFSAGAEVAITASYQASREAFARVGVPAAEADALIARSVALAAAVRAADGRAGLLVAGSVGPYGAMLADGQEYTGAYGGATVDDLVAFHRPRIAALLGAGADLLAYETIPSGDEARAIALLQAELDGVPAWVSFQCRDAQRIADGTPVGEAVAAVADAPGVLAVGLNCTKPEHVAGALAAMAAVSSLPLVAYPNAGRTWNGLERTWSGAPRETFADDEVAAWRAAGARLVGGCCGIGPRGIAALARG